MLGHAVRLINADMDSRVMFVVAYCSNDDVPSSSYSWRGHHFESPQLAFNTMQQKAHQAHVISQCFKALSCILFWRACARSLEVVTRRGWTA